MNKNWKVLQPDPNSAREIQTVLKCSDVLAAILVNRNILSQADVSRFLSASLKDLRPPFSIKGMDAAVRRIHTALMNNEKIMIFGDYDVDGITATTLLLEFLRCAGADACHYIPHRIKEGYSLQTHHISGHALPNHIRLIITVDCASKSHDAVEMAQASGIDVIVTDHHSISENMPPALAVVNPKRQDCDAGFENLAGVGVAFCVVICLRKYLRDMGFWQTRPEPNLKRFCDLVALGTVADVVPLVGENRILSKAGVEMLNATHRPGIRALIKGCAISGPLSGTDDILFRLAPRLNAAGRLDHANTAVELLTTDDPETARNIVRSLNHINQKRQSIEKKIFEDILEYLDRHPERLRQHSLVLSGPKWHAGVIGIVASKVVEKYFRPVVLISTQNGVGRGSGRSIPGIDLHAGLVACAHDLEYFGGHPMAAGLTIKTDHIERFQKNFDTAIRNIGTPNDYLQTLRIDHELDFNDISEGLTNELESLEPYGEGNPEPLFMARNVRVASSKIVGGNHRRMTLRQHISGRPSRTVKAIQFNVNMDKPLQAHFDQIAFRLRWNRWNSRKTEQIIIEES